MTINKKLIPNKVDKFASGETYRRLPNRYASLHKWQQMYILLHADYTNKENEGELSTRLGKSPRTLQMFRENYPHFDSMVEEAQHRQRAKLGNAAMKILFEKMKKSDKCLAMALEISQRYSPKQVIEQRFNSREEGLKFVRDKLRGFIHPKDDDIDGRTGIA